MATRYQMGLVILIGLAILYTGTLMSETRTVEKRVCIDSGLSTEIDEDCGETGVVTVEEEQTIRFPIMAVGAAMAVGGTLMLMDGTRDTNEIDTNEIEDDEPEG